MSEGNLKKKIYDPMVETVKKFHRGCRAFTEIMKASRNEHNNMRFGGIVRYMCQQFEKGNYISYEEAKKDYKGSF